MAAFAASGLVHELVISVPARGGWGGPTLYFLLQGAAVLLQKRLGFLSRGIPGRLFTFGILLAPAWLLFHPPFMQRVLRPLLAAMGFI